MRGRVRAPVVEEHLLPLVDQVALLTITVTIGRYRAPRITSSWLVIWKQPSPSTQTTVASGRAAFARAAAETLVPPRAEATGGDEAARLADERVCIAHIWCWPTPVVQITSSVTVPVEGLDHLCSFSESLRRTGAGTGRGRAPSGAATARSCPCRPRRAASGLGEDPASAVQPPAGVRAAELVDFRRRRCQDR